MAEKDTSATTAERKETRSPEEIRADIAATREELGETVEAVAKKADVKAQAKQKVDETKAQARERVDHVKAGAAANQVQAKAREKPLPFAVAGALVAGVVLGRLTAR